MQKNSIVFFILLFTTKILFSQSRLVFEKYNFDTSYQLIGVPYFYDDDKTYQSLSFLINDTLNLKKVQGSIVYGKRIDSPIVESNSLNIYIVKNKKVINELDVSPKFKNIGIADSDTSTTWEYEFDFSKLSNLANTTPLNYLAKVSKFKTQQDYDDYINKHKNDKDFLCYKDESEQFDGKGIIYIKINSTINSATKAEELLTNELKRITLTKDYLISYFPTLDNKITYKFTINTSKNIYAKIFNALFEKLPWIYNDKEVIIYRRK